MATLGLKVQVDGVDEVPPAAPTAGIAKIRDLHHRVAQMLAAGVRETEVAARTGMTPARISLLKNDPTFAELLGFYQTERREIYRDVLAQMKSLSSDALAELHDRLLDDPGSFGVKSLMDLAVLGLDRTGHAPAVKVQAQHLHLTPEDLRTLREEIYEPSRVGGAAELCQAPEVIGIAGPGDSVPAEGGAGGAGGGAAGRGDQGGSVDLGRDDALQPRHLRGDACEGRGGGGKA